MKILIPTRGRFHDQPTADLLAAAGIQFTLVLNWEDNTRYAYPSIRIHAANIVQKRQTIINRYGSDKLVMLDDDMKFYWRLDNKFIRIGDSPSDKIELRSLFNRIERELDSFVHIGVASRFMAQNLDPECVTGGKYIRVLAYNFNLFNRRNDLAVRPAYRFPGHEDHDFNMQLQRMGYPNRVISCYAQEDYGQFASGGCATWRTPASDLLEIKRFGSAWPSIISFGKPNEKYPGGRMKISWRKLRQYWKQPLTQTLV